MTGMKFKLAHRRADKGTWNASVQAQRRHLSRCSQAGQRRPETRSRREKAKSARRKRAERTRLRAATRGVEARGKREALARRLTTSRLTTIGPLQARTPAPGSWSHIVTQRRTDTRSVTVPISRSATSSSTTDGAQRQRAPRSLFQAGWARSARLPPPALCDESGRIVLPVQDGGDVGPEDGVDAGEQFVRSVSARGSQRGGRWRPPARPPERTCWTSRPRTWRRCSAH
jgi:hypothetical protein